MIVSRGSVSDTCLAHRAQRTNRAPVEAGRRVRRMSGTSDHWPDDVGAPSSLYRPSTPLCVWRQSDEDRNWTRQSRQTQWAQAVEVLVQRVRACVRASCELCYRADTAWLTLIFVTELLLLLAKFNMRPNQSIRVVDSIIKSNDIRSSAVSKRPCRWKVPTK